MTRKPETFDNRTGRPLGAAGDYTDYAMGDAGPGNLGQSTSASWAAYNAANTGSTPPSANLPTITVTATPITSAGFPWWFWLAVGLAGGYVVATQLGGGLTRHLKRLTKTLAPAH